MRCDSVIIISWNSFVTQRLMKVDFWSRCWRLLRFIILSLSLISHNIIYRLRPVGPLLPVGPRPMAYVAYWEIWPRRHAWSEQSSIYKVYLTTPFLKTQCFECESMCVCGYACFPTHYFLFLLLLSSLSNRIKKK